MSKTLKNTQPRCRPLLEEIGAAHPLTGRFRAGAPDTTLVPDGSSASSISAGSLPPPPGSTSSPA
jgi:hypothetical protein